MAIESNLRVNFGDPESILKKFQGRPVRLHPSGIVPGYHLLAYQTAFRELGVEPFFLSSRYRKESFEHGLVATNEAAKRGELGVVLVHAPRTKYNETPTRFVFEQASHLTIRGETCPGGILPLYIATEGNVYLFREDSYGKKYPIAEDYDEGDEYDCTAEAKKEGWGLGALTVILEKNRIEKQIHELVHELGKGKIPSRRVLNV